MIPFGDKTVTVLHRTGSSYMPYILHGCSWRAAKIRSVNGAAVERSPETTCRIPAGQTIPDVGDVMILGAYNIKADGEIALVRLLNELLNSGVQAMRVMIVRDNSKGVPMPHYAVTGGI